jgi:hypothetical protein
MLQELFLNAVKTRDVQEIENFLGIPEIDPSFNNNEALLCALDAEDKAVADLLTDDVRYKPTENLNDFLNNLTLGTNSFDWLLNQAKLDPNYRNGYLIRNACKSGKKELVELLVSLDKTDLNVAKGAPLRLATYYGHDEIADLLNQDRRIISGPKYHGF